MQDDQSGRAMGDKVYEALEGGLEIVFRVKNHRVDYSISNRPPHVDINDHLLATALVEAGSAFDFKRTGKPPRPDAVYRTDGRKVVYKHRIRIDYAERTLTSSANKSLTLQVMSVVIEQLMRVFTASQPNPPEELN